MSADNVLLNPYHPDYFYLSSKHYEPQSDWGYPACIIISFMIKEKCKNLAEDAII